MSKITVDGTAYKVLDNLGFQNGYYVKEVATDSGNKMAVRAPGSKTWRFWGVADKICYPGPRPCGQSQSAREAEGGGS